MQKTIVETTGELLQFGLVTHPGTKIDGTLIFERPAFVFRPRRLRNCSLGAFSYVNYTAGIYPSRIGRYCSIAEGVTLGPPEHPVDWFSLHPFAFTRPMHVPDFYELPEFARLAPDGSESATFEMPLLTYVGHDVWIGAGAVIKRGVRIGDGAIIGAGAVVTSDVPPYAIMVGAPARVLRLRFPEKLVERFVDFAWWRYDLAPHKHLVDFADPERTLETLEELLATNVLAELQPPTVRVTQSGTRFEVRTMSAPLYRFAPPRSGNNADNASSEAASPGLASTVTPRELWL